MRRSRWVGSVLSVAIACAAPLLHAESTEDVQKALADKQAAREKARAVVVRISTGELDDLKAKVAVLQAQVDGLRAQLAAQQAPPRRRFDEVELGMTTAEVKAFVEQHKDYLSLVGLSATAGVSKSASQVRVKETDRSTVSGNGQQTVRTGPDAQDPAAARQSEGVQQSQLDTDKTRKVEVTQTRAKHEVMEIAKFVTVRRQTGTHVGEFGQTFADFGDFTERAGTINVTLDDDVVTAVDAH